MPIATHCPKCNAKLKGPDNLVGHTLKCPGCKTPVAITAASLAPGAGPRPPNPPAVKPVTNPAMSGASDDFEIVYDDLEILDDDAPVQPPPRPAPVRSSKPKPAPPPAPKRAPVKAPVKPPEPPPVFPNMDLDADDIKLQDDADEEIPLVEEEEVVFDEFELVQEHQHPEIPELPEVIEEEILDVLPVAEDDVDELEVVDDAATKPPKRRRSR
jgi:hypothetical protein